MNSYKEYCYYLTTGNYEMSKNIRLDLKGMISQPHQMNVKE